MRLLWQSPQVVGMVVADNVSVCWESELYNGFGSGIMPLLLCLYWEPCSVVTWTECGATSACTVASVSLFGNHTLSPGSNCGSSLYSGKYIERYYVLWWNHYVTMYVTTMPLILADASQCHNFLFFILFFTRVSGNPQKSPSLCYCRSRLLCYFACLFACVHHFLRLLMVYSFPHTCANFNGLGWSLCTVPACSVSSPSCCRHVAPKKKFNNS